MNILDGKLVSKKIEEELTNKISKLKTKLQLVVIRVGDDPASEVYINMKSKACERVGIIFNSFHLNEDILASDLESLINKLNQDKEVTGIILQLPLPKHLDALKLVNMINPNKDVDGLTLINQGKLWQGSSALAPCTPLGVMKLLEYYQIPLESKNAVVIGRSLLVGKPIMNLLINANATVTMCHSKTKNLETITKNADIIISAVGIPNLITKDMIKEDAVIVDVSITRNNGKLVGDVHREVYDMANVTLSPVPGGVGPMTVAMVVNNVYQAYLISQNK